MANCESTQTYKIPLKSCQNSMIDHNLVTIWFGIEWAERDHDDPSLLVNIANKLPPMPCFQQNQPPLLVNSVHHHHQHQHQESLGSTYQQQQQQQQYYHTSGMNNYDPLNSTIANPHGDHNDVSSMTTTTTVVYNSLQPQQQSSVLPTEIQKIKSYLQSAFPQTPQGQPPFNQSYLSSQNVIQAPCNDLNDSRLDLKMLNFSPTSSMKQRHSVITPYFDLPQSSMMPCPPPPPPPPTPTSNNLQYRSLICTCPNPTNCHAPNCPAYSLTHQEPNINFLLESMDRPAMNRTNIQRIPSAPPTHVSSVMSIPTMKESMIGTTVMPFSNPNLMKSMDPSASVTTIISQPSSFSNNTSIYPTIQVPSMNGNNSFQQLPFNVSQVIINNQPTYPTNPSMPVPMIREPTTNPTKPRPRKRSPTKRTKKPDKTPNKTQPNSNPPSLLSSPIGSQKGMFVMPENSQIADNTLPGSMNDSKVTNVQQSSPTTNTNVRSPVEINVTVSKPSNQTTDVSGVVDETITEVLQGKGNIPIHTPSTPQQTKPSLIARMVLESNEPTTTKTYVSPLYQEQQPSMSTSNDQSIIHITEQGVFPSIAEQNQMNTSSATNNTKKRVQSKPTNNAKPKRTAKSMVSTSPVTSTSNIGGKPSPWSDTRTSSSSGDSATITSVVLPDYSFINSSLNILDVNRVNYSMSSPERIQVIHTNDQHHGIMLHDIFSPENDKEFHSSTPPPLTLPMSSSMNSVSIKNSSDTSNVLVTNINDPFDDFLSPNPLSSSSIWQEDQVTSTVMIPSDPPNNILPEQQSYSRNDPYLKSQTHTSQYPEKTKLNHSHPMNNNNDVQRASKQPTKSSKLLKKPNRLNPIKKSSTSQQACTRCGHTRLIDITRHEFPKQKGLVFECASCGNSSIRSNVSIDERKRRLAKVAADHLNKFNCQFCPTIFHSHDDYIIHLRIDHQSIKPM